MTAGSTCGGMNWGTLSAGLGIRKGLAGEDRGELLMKFYIDRDSSDGSYMVGKMRESFGEIYLTSVNTIEAALAFIAEYREGTPQRIVIETEDSF